MSYYKFDWKGKEYKLKFNQLALEIIKSKASSKVTSQNVYAMFWGGLKGNAYVKEVELEEETGEVDKDGKKITIPITFEMVCDLIDEIYTEKRLDIIIEVEKVFTETQLYKSYLPEEKEEEKEKKSKPLRKVG